MKRQIGSFYYKPKANAEGLHRRRWNWPNIIWRAVKKTCTVIGAIVLFSICMGLLAGFLLGGGARHMPNDMILVFNVEDGIGETPVQMSLADPFTAQTLTVRELIETLDHAKHDKRVRGLLVSLDDSKIELAHIQELRKAIMEFRQSGKFAKIYTPSFADLGSGIGAYYFATAFDQIWMQPVGFLSITGISMEMPFAKGALDKVGAKAQFLHREEYKSAMESFTNTDMSPANREMMSSILDNLSGQLVSDITEARKLKADAFKAYMDKGLLSGEEAVKDGLIDRVDYADVLVDETREKITGKKDGDEPPLVLIEDYYDSLKHRLAKTGSKEVALVTISGEIIPGADPKPGYATSDYISQAIDDATDDDNIKAIVIRVDSPGGSPSASETIRRSIVKAKEAGKKVIVSMGPVAASGGYWLSVDADHIFAMPSTLTGSIGVIMGKFEVSALWDKLGINWDGLHWGQNSQMWSPNQPFNDAQLATMNEAIDNTYNGFIDRVAAGRHLKRDVVHALAKGRAYTGIQGLKLGLVDDIGGLNDALDYTAKQIGAKNRKGLNVIEMPKPLGTMEQLMMMLGQQAAIGKFFNSNSTLLNSFEPLAHRAQAMDHIGPFQTYDPDLKNVRD